MQDTKEVVFHECLWLFHPTCDYYLCLVGICVEYPYEMGLKLVFQLSPRPVRECLTKIFAISMYNFIIASIPQLKHANYCLWCSFQCVSHVLLCDIGPFFCTCFPFNVSSLFGPENFILAWRIEAISDEST